MRLSAASRRLAHLFMIIFAGIAAPLQNCAGWRVAMALNEKSRPESVTSATSGKDQVSISRPTLASLGIVTPNVVLRAECSPNSARRAFADGRLLACPALAAVTHGCGL